MASRDADTLNLMKFGIGQPVPRQEDPTLLRGQGRYTDDINLPDQAYAVMVRSQVAHGILKGIDTPRRKTMPGVLGVLTGADLDAAGFGPLKTLMNVPQRDGSPMKTPTAPFARHGQGALRRRSGGLRRGRDGGAGQGRGRSRRARHRGAARRHRRRREAPKPGAPQIHDDAPGNSALDFHYGDAEGERRPSPRPRTSRGCEIWSATASSSAPWSRARRSAPTMPRPTATSCTPATRA